MRLHEAVHQRDGQSADQEGDVNDGLPHQNLFTVVGSIDERFQQMNGADADDGCAQFDFQD